MAELSYTVTGIHCGGCAKNIESGLRRLDGVLRVSADPDTQVVRARYDEQRLDTGALAARLERLGYPVADPGGGE